LAEAIFSLDNEVIERVPDFGALDEDLLYDMLAKATSASSDEETD
jgi:hypothetical protein